MSELDRSVDQQNPVAVDKLGDSDVAIKLPTKDLSSLTEGLNGFLVEVGKFIVNMKNANDRRNIVYKDLDGYLKILAEHSWFISLNLSWHDYEYLSFSFSDAPKEKSLVADFLNDRFTKCYAENFDYLWAKAVEQFPNREFAINPAARAHLCGDYALSIPVFMSQAEGMIRDLTKAELFSKTTPKFTNVSDVARTKHSQVVQLGSWLSYADAAHWAQLKDPLPIALNDTDRKKRGYNGLNRNTVLHGIDIEYATELNSFKAFSLMCHAAGIGEVLKKEAEEANGS